jgi:thiamine-phosphate pyrophosphorylase
MLVTDLSVTKSADRLIEKMNLAIEGGVDWVQVRDRRANEDALARLAERVVKESKGRAKVVVNGSLAAAHAAGADGVHLPEGAEMIRERGLIVGRSVHSAPAAFTAEDEGAGYIVAGPVFATDTHAGLPPLGPRLIEEIAAAVSIPVIGIGGINAARAASVIASGASGVAVIRAILQAGDPRGQARAIREAIEEARGL